MARQKDVKKISELIYLELTVSHIEVERVSKLSKRQPDAFFHLPEVSISSSMIGKRQFLNAKTNAWTLKDQKSFRSYRNFWSYTTHVLEFGDGEGYFQPWGLEHEHERTHGREFVRGSRAFLL